jgi:hypothetical protein
MCGDGSQDVSGDSDNEIIAGDLELIKRLTNIDYKHTTKQTPKPPTLTTFLIFRLG